MSSAHEVSDFGLGGPSQRTA